MSRLWVCHCIAHTKSLLTGIERKVGVTFTVPGRNRADAARRARQEIVGAYDSPNVARVSGGGLGEVATAHRIGG